MNTNRPPSIGPDPGVNRSGRALLSAAVCLLHAQFPSRSAAMNAIIDATLRARAPRGALPVASTRSMGGFPGRLSTSGSEVWDEENISISFQLLYGLTMLSLPNSNGALFALDRQVQKSGDRALAVWKELDHIAALGKAHVGNRHQL